MHANLMQLSRIAVLLDDAENPLARVEPTPTHRLDGTIFATVDAALHVIDRNGVELPVERYVGRELGLMAA